MTNPKPSKSIQKIAQKLLARILEKRAELAQLPHGRANVSLDALRKAVPVWVELYLPGRGDDTQIVEGTIRAILGGQFGDTILALEEAEHVTRWFIDMVENDSINRLVETIYKTRHELARFSDFRQDQVIQVLQALAEIEPLVLQWNHVIKGVSDNRVLRAVANAKQYCEDHAQSGMDIRFAKALDEAKQIALEFNLPSTTVGLAHLLRWLLLSPPKLDDVLPHVSPVRVYWARSVYATTQYDLDKPGKAELWDFIRPGHIYIDVTFATKQDLGETMGRRRSKTDIKKESVANLATIDTFVHSQPAGARRKRIQKKLERQGFRTERNRKAIQEQRISEAALREMVMAHPDWFWLAPKKSPRTVSEIQDVQEIGKMETSLNPMQKVAKAGRAKGDPRPHKLWLKGKTRPQVLDHLRQHPEEIDKIEQDYVQFRVDQERAALRAEEPKKNAFLRKAVDPLSVRERKKIERQARDNFKNLIRLPLQHERAKR